MLIHFPAELLGIILLLTSLHTRLSVITLVCKGLHYFVYNHDLLWSRLNLNRIKTISNEALLEIFTKRLPQQTRHFIRELYLNDTHIQLETTRTILFLCPNLVAIHLRLNQKDISIETVTTLVCTLADENKKNSFKLETIYFYMKGEGYVAQQYWWTNSNKRELEASMKRLTGNERCSVQIPWCDSCNNERAAFRTPCALGCRKRDKYGCFACTDYGRRVYICELCEAEKALRIDSQQPSAY